MEWLVHHNVPRWIVLHFQNALSPTQERRMRHHLARCEVCRALYDVQYFLEQKTHPEAHHRHARMEHALFGPPIHRATSYSHWTIRIGIPATAMALLFLVGIYSFFRSDTLNFREKSASMDTLVSDRFVSLYAYKRIDDRALEPSDGKLHNKQALAFAYSNNAQNTFRYLMVFAVDESYEIYWYYPAWTNASANPPAIPIRAGSGIELPEEIIHDYKGRTLTLYALFMQKQMRVDDIEKLVATLSSKLISPAHLEHNLPHDVAVHQLSMQVIK